MIQHMKTLLFVLLCTEKKLFKISIFKQSFWSHYSHSLLAVWVDKWTEHFTGRLQLVEYLCPYYLFLLKSEFLGFWDPFVWLTSCSIFLIQNYGLCLRYYCSLCLWNCYFSLTHFWRRTGWKGLQIILKKN